MRTGPASSRSQHDFPIDAACYVAATSLAAVRNVLGETDAALNLEGRASTSTTSARR